MFDTLRKNIFSIIDINDNISPNSRLYDFFSAAILIVNIIVSSMETFSQFSDYVSLLSWIEAVTVVFFGFDCFLRIWTAKFQYPDIPQGKAICRYIFSFYGIIDILSFVPYFLPIFFPSGMAAFRLLRIFRIFRLFKMNSYSDSLGIIAQVLKSKWQQLVSSVILILVLMIFSSLCMYSIEHDAQPEIFSDAFSGIWWSVSTLLTVGYGDIYPITTL